MLDPAELVEIGQFGRPHGVRGELRYFPIDPDSELLEPGFRVFVRVIDATDEQIFELSSLRAASKFDLVRLQGVDSREKAETLTNAAVLIDPADLPQLDEDEFYLRDLIGLQVHELLTRDGDDTRQIGEVGGFFETGANDVMVVELAGGERLLVPVIDEAIAEIDLPDRVLLWPLADWAPADTSLEEQ